MTPPLGRSRQGIARSPGSRVPGAGDHGHVRTASGPGQGMLPLSGLDDELVALGEEVARLRAENARLLRLLELSPREARPPGPAQTGIFDARPARCTPAPPPRRRSPSSRRCSAPAADVYALRWENARLGDSGWFRRCGAGGARACRHAKREYLPLTEEVITAHLSGELELGPLSAARRRPCAVAGRGFRRARAMLDALAYLKAARAVGAPAALEVSRSGRARTCGCSSPRPVPAETARQVGRGCSGRPSPCAGGWTCPATTGCSHRRTCCRRRAGQPHRGAAAGPRAPRRRDGLPRPGHAGATRGPVGLPVHRRRLTPREVDPARRPARGGAGRARRSTGCRCRHLHQDAVRTGRGGPGHVRRGDPVEGAELTPALLATLKHAASMPNPVFYERQRRRVSTWDTPRFLRSYDETLTGELILPRGLPDRRRHAGRAGRQPPRARRRADRRATQHLRFTADARPSSRPRGDALAGHELGVLVAPPGAGKTVMACALIAAPRRLHARAGRPQGTGRPVAHPLAELLGVKAGQLGGGRSKTTGHRRHRDPADPRPPRRRRRPDRRLRAGRRRRVPPRAGRRVRARGRARSPPAAGWG